MSHLFSLSYYFQPVPGDFKFSKLMLIFGIALILASFVVSYIRKKKVKDDLLKKMLRRYPGLLRTYGILVLVLLYFREASIPFLSMRIGWAILLAFILYSLYKVIFKFKKEYKRRLQQANTNKGTNKYIPKPKRKKK